MDTDLSEQFTIIDVFAHDRQGLLYVITRTIFEQGLSIHFAKVSTRLDQIVDVFYVTDRSGRKVTDPGKLQTIRELLKQRVDAFLTDPLVVQKASRSA